MPRGGAPAGIRTTREGLPCHRSPSVGALAWPPRPDRPRPPAPRIRADLIPFGVPSTSAHEETEAQGQYQAFVCALVVGISNTTICSSHLTGERPSVAFIGWLSRGWMESTRADEGGEAPPAPTCLVGRTRADIRGYRERKGSERRLIERSRSTELDQPALNRLVIFVYPGCHLLALRAYSATPGLLSTFPLGWSPSDRLSLEPASFCVTAIVWEGSFGPLWGSS